MQKTGEDKNYIYFMDHFQDTPVQVMQDKKTGEIFFNADDVVKILGLGDNIKEFLETFWGVDMNFYRGLIIDALKRACLRLHDNTGFHHIHAFPVVQR